MTSKYQIGDIIRMEHRRKVRKFKVMKVEESYWTTRHKTHYIITLIDYFTKKRFSIHESELELKVGKYINTGTKLGRALNDML